MAVKSITLDLEAYERLRRAKRGNESFSETVKRLIPQQMDYDAYLKRIESLPPNDEYVRIMDDVIAKRGNHDHTRRQDGLP